MSTLYHLIRARDGAYWRHDGKGYTDKIIEAGTFDSLYSFQVVCGTHGEHRREVASPVTDDIALMREALEAVAVIAGRIEKAIPEYRYEMDLVRRALVREIAAYRAAEGKGEQG